ncbi:MAG: twin-arginine translocation signal domain-containing protein [Chloroflexi bacterium]|nr:twin-arginine translocation signal domain-containing protein [Chloroflexota bacterium]
MITRRKFLKLSSSLVGLVGLSGLRRRRDVAAPPLPPKPGGRVIFVDGSDDGAGDDDNDGLTPETAVFSWGGAMRIVDKQG